jgi:hypothetical protein
VASAKIDGTPLLDGEFRVYEQEPPEEFRRWGADSTIGLDMFENWKFTFDYTRRAPSGVIHDLLERGPTCSLTTRQAR